MYLFLLSFVYTDIYWICCAPLIRILRNSLQYDEESPMCLMSPIKATFLSPVVAKQAGSVRSDKTDFTLTTA